MPVLVVNLATDNVLALHVLGQLGQHLEDAVLPHCVGKQVLKRLAVLLLDYPQSTDQGLSN